MKLLFTIVLFHFSLCSFAQPDSTNKNWKFHGVIQLNNNGISPVPAFSLGKPALMTSLFLQKRSFVFSPEFNYGTDGKPWVINQWFRYQKMHEKFTYQTGINLSLFFKRNPALNGNEEVITLDRYMAFEGLVSYHLSKKTRVNLVYWNSKGLSSTAIKSGHFISLSANISKIPLSKSLFLDLRPNFFYLKNKLPFEGLFISGIASISYKTFPVSVFIQGVQPITVEPATDPNWNFGLNYIF